MTSLITVDPITQGKQIIELPYDLPKYKVGDRVRINLNKSPFEVYISEINIFIFRNMKQDICSTIEYKSASGIKFYESEIENYADIK